MTRFAIRDVEGERGQNQAEMEWKKTGGESKEGETGKEGWEEVGGTRIKQRW